MGQRPQDLVFTLFGEYLLHRDGPVWVGSLISLLEPFDISESAVRTVLSRMVGRGWLRTRRVGRRAFYALTEEGRALLEEGRQRIRRPPRDVPWDGAWYLFAYSIPEDRRHLRDRLRTRLAWMGLGSLGNGLWLSPHPVAREVDEVARSLGISHHVVPFRAELLGKGGADELVRQCWDLAAVNHRYQAFLKRWRPLLARCVQASEAGSLDPEQAYVLRFRLIHEFREFPLEDPYLPKSLLPTAWRGFEAAELVEELHAVCADPADRYVDVVLGEAE